MSKEFKVEIFKRELSNKSYLNALRKDNKIPGIYYSHDSKDSTPIYITSESLKEAQKSDSKIFNISVGGKKINVLFKSFDFHPITDEILHVDFYGVDMNRPVTVKTSIILTGSAIGVIEEGGILVQSLNDLEIECLPSDIPDTIEVDISNLSLGDAVRVSDITIEEKLTLKTNVEQTIASVTHAMKEEELQPVIEEDEDAEFMEGEEGEELASDADSDTASSSEEKQDDKNKKNE